MVSSFSEPRWIQYFQLVWRWTLLVIAQYGRAYNHVSFTAFTASIILNYADGLFHLSRHRFQVPFANIFWGLGQGLWLHSSHIQSLYFASHCFDHRPWLWHAGKGPLLREAPVLTKRPCGNGSTTSAWVKVCVQWSPYKILQLRWNLNLNYWLKLRNLARMHSEVYFLCLLCTTLF